MLSVHSDTWGLDTIEGHLWADTTSPFDPYTDAIRKPCGRVTVYWGGALLDSIAVETGPATESNWLFTEVPEIIQQVADEITTVPHKWFQCDNKTPLNQMYAAPSTLVEASSNQVGWWGSEVSDGSGDFAIPQELAVRTSSRPILSISIVGDDAYSEYPVDFRVQIFSGLGGGVLRYDESVTGNAAVTWQDSAVLDLSGDPIKDATLTILTITKWSATGAVAKIVEFYDSVSVTYDDDEIIRFSVLEESEIADATLPTGNISANQLELSLNNTDDKFFPGNTGAALNSAIRQNRKIVVEAGLEISGVPTYLPMGTFWSGNWRIGELATSISTAALDRMGRLRKTAFFTGEVYADQTVGDIAEIILDNAIEVMPDLTYVIDSALYGTEYTIPLAYFPRQSHFDALKTLAEACIGRVYVDRSDVIQFEAPAEPAAYTTEITADNYFTRVNPEGTNQLANRIEVVTQPLTEVSESNVYTSGETLTMGAGDIETFTITYKNSPVPDTVTIAVQAVSGSAFVGVVNTAVKYAWGAEVTVYCTVAGGFKIKVSGSIYEVEGPVVVVREDENSQIEYGEQRFELAENPLIQTEDLARVVAQGLLDSFKNPDKDVELDWRGNLAVLLGQVVRIPIYVKDAISVKGDYTVYKQQNIYDGTLRATLSARLVKVVETVTLQDTDGAYMAQDTDGALVVYQME